MRWEKYHTSSRTWVVFPPFILFLKNFFPGCQTFFLKKFIFLYYIDWELDLIIYFYFFMRLSHVKKCHDIGLIFHLEKKKKNKFSTFKKSLKCVDQIFQWDKNTSFFKLFIRLIFLKLFPPKSFLFQFGSQ